MQFSTVTYTLPNSGTRLTQCRKLITVEASVFQNAVPLSTPTSSPKFSTPILSASPRDLLTHQLHFLCVHELWSQRS